MIGDVFTEHLDQTNIQGRTHDFDYHTNRFNNTINTLLHYIALEFEFIKETMQLSSLE
jgi:hypothetical protein